jgi:rod shape-determining protein MreD
MAARGWPYGVFIAVLVVLHFTVHLGIGVGPGGIDLLTIAVLLGVRRTSGARGALLGLLVGLLQDSLSLLAFGAQSVTYALLGYLGARSRDLFYGDSVLFVVLYLFVGKWLHDLLYYGLAGAAVRGEPVARFLVDAPVAALWTAAVGTAALLLYRALSRER